MANPFTTPVDLAAVAAGTGGLILAGLAASDEFGVAVAAAGDVNGDGVDDFIVGAHRNDRGGNDAGAAYVVFGSGNTTQSVTGFFEIRGESAGDYAGRSVSAAGDVNGDGIADVIVGAPGNNAGGIDAGAAYVVYGRSSGFPASVDLAAVASGSGGFKIIGQDARDGAGVSVSAAGDVNGDGIGDVVVGASRNGSGGPYAGAAYVVYGRTGGLANPVDLDAVALGSGGFKIQGEFDYDYAGIAVSSAGDLNGDGIGDVVVGAYRNDSGGANAGAAYVIYGRTGARPGVVDLDAGPLGTAGFKIQGQDGNDFTGIAVSSAGDVNGDGTADLLIGSQRNVNGGAQAGAAYVVFGRTGGLVGSVDLDAVAQGTGGFKILAENADDRAGTSVASAGDVNGDGLADLIVGAYWNDGATTDAGAAYVVYGRVGGFASGLDLDAVAAGKGGFKIAGESASDYAGRAVSRAGDINGDGLADLLVGANGHDGAGRDAGAAYLIFGRAETITAGADSAGGTAASDTVDLLGGDDYYDGKAGNDRITGGTGADFLRGRGGDDTFLLTGDLLAPSGATVRNVDMRSSNGVVDARNVSGATVTLDILDGGDGNDTVTGTSLADVVVLSAPGSLVYAGQNATSRIASIETFRLGGGNDVLSLTTTASTKYTTGVAAYGENGNDALWTGAGNDLLDGGEGNDFLVGGAGDDSMFGGAGADIFGFAPGMGRDVVFFSPSEGDKIRIKGFGAGLDSFADLRASGAIVATTTGGPIDLPQTELRLGSGTTIVLSLFNANNLTADHFQFVA